MSVMRNWLRKKRLEEAIKKGGFTFTTAGNEIFDDTVKSAEKTKLTLKNGLLKFLKKWGM